MQSGAQRIGRRPTESCIHRCTPDYALASWGSIFIVIWRQNTTAAGIQDLAAQCKKFATSRPAGVALLTIIYDGAPAPGARERTALATFLKAADYIRGSGVVMEGTSFRAAFVRGVVTGLTMLAHQPFPHQVCSLEAAGRLFAGLLEGTEPGFDLSSFKRGVDELREAIEKRLGDPVSSKVGGAA
jgi:hypothetical protein